MTHRTSTPAGGRRRLPVPRPRTLAACALALLLGATGCSGGEGDAPASRADLTGGSIGADPDLAGVNLSVGSKEFTENVILAKIAIYALRAAGADVTDKTGLMGSTILRTSLEKGDLDLYWEYSGTGWTQHLQREKAIPHATDQFEATRKRDARENGIAWMGPARFGNQYAIARASDAPAPVSDVADLGDLSGLVRAHPEEASFCGAAEFMDREWESFQDAYDARFPVARTYQMELALNYVNVAKGSPCNFAEVLSTDARIRSLDLDVLDDTEHHFTTELAALTAREDTVERHPEIQRLAERLGDRLTEDTIIELNGMVDLEGRTEDEAALHFLRENGFIGG